MTQHDTRPTQHAVTVLDHELKEQTSSSTYLLLPPGSFCLRELAVELRELLT